MSTPLMILAVLGTALAIYIVCSLIDFIREFIFKKLRIKQRLLNFEEKHINVWNENEQ